MKKKVLEIISGIFATFLNYIPVLLAVMSLYYGVFKREPNFVELMLLVLVPCGFYVIRYLKVNVWMFFSLHILLTVVVFCLSEGLVQKIVYTLVAGLFFFLSAYFTITKHQVEESILFVAMTVIITFISYFVVSSQGGQEAGQIVAFLGTLYALIYLGYLFLHGFLDYVRNNAVSTKNIPEKQILFTGTASLSGFLFLFGAMAFLVIKGNFFADLIYKLIKLVEKFLIWLLRKAPEGMEQGTADEMVEEIPDIMEGMGEAEQAVSSLPENVVEIINNVVTIGAYCIIVAFILGVAVALIKAIFAAFKVNAAKNEKETIVPKETVTKIQRKEKQKKEKRTQFSRERKIRRMYQQLIVKKSIEGEHNKERKSNLIKALYYQTPSKHCERVKNSVEVKEMYEKVRYSGIEPTKEDLHRMKDMCIY